MPNADVVDADRAHALVARCLTQPDFLAVALEQARNGSSPLVGAAELERIALFAGFITKVKHNPLRSVLPCTLHLLALLGDEVAFFTSYVPAYAAHRANGPLTLDRQVELMSDALRAFIRERPARIRAAFDDMLRHEATLARLASHDAANGDDVGSRASVRWRGRFALERYAFDVASAYGALQQREFDLATGLRERDNLLGYWRPRGSDEVIFFETDELTALLFGLVDGHRTVADVARVLAANGLDEIAPAELEAFFGEAEERGFVAVGTPCG